LAEPALAKLKEGPESMTVKDRAAPEWKKGMVGKLEGFSWIKSSLYEGEKIRRAFLGGKHYFGGKC
jgi:hypothetical protein